MNASIITAHLKSSLVPVRGWMDGFLRITLVIFYIAAFIITVEKKKSSILSTVYQYFKTFSVPVSHPKPTGCKRKMKLKTRVSNKYQ